MYVPKYVLKRLVPEGAVKLINNKLSVEVTNILTPIPFSDIPGDILDLLEIKLDGNVVVDKNKRDISKNVQILWRDKTYNIAQIKEVAEGTLPVGDKMTIVLPNFNNFKIGEKHNIELTIKIDNPINIGFERTIC